MKQTPLIRPSLLVISAALSAMALVACGQNTQNAPQNTTADTAAPALPLTTGAETAAVYAPSVNALPPAPRPKIVRVASQADQYAYVDQASSMGSALGSAPPDYGFDYEGVHPWVWRTNDNAVRLVEPIDGGNRYYYYQPGAASPYLIRDPQYAYGFNDGQLVVVYDARGNVVAPEYMDRQADDAGRYLARAQALYNASLRSQRRAVIAANWAARRAAINAQQAEWARQQSEYSGWTAYHQQHEAEQQAYWQAERERRQASTASFDQWRDQDYRGAPPPLTNRPDGGYPPAPPHDGGYQNGGYPNGGRPGGPNRPNQYPGGAPNDRQGYAPASNPPNPQPNQAAFADARRQQALADAAHQAQAQQQAQAATAARAQAIDQGRQQQAAADTARQAESQRQGRALADARHQQQQADALRQAQTQAAQAHQQQAAQAAAAQAATAHQAQDTARAQAQAARQAQDAARAQAMAAHQQQAAVQATAQHAAEGAAQADAARAAQQAARHNAPTRVMPTPAAAAPAAAAPAAGTHPHHEGGPGRGPHRDGGGPNPAQP